MKRDWKTLMAGVVMGWLAGFSSAWALPKYDHVVIVLEENHSFKQILEDGKKECPYINQLAGESANMTQAHGISHPSLPNYLALFSGSDQKVTDDDCKYSFSGDHLASELLKAGFTFVGYSESQPKAGSTICQAGGKNGYYRKHNPWVYWQESGSFPATLSQTFKAFPKGPDYSSLPTVCFVIPNEAHDMHDPNGYPPAADKWLKKNLNAYYHWAKAHNSLLIVTWDEDNYGEDNRIPTIFAGAGIKQGQYPEKITHYSVLRTIEDMFGLKPLGESKNAKAITDIFE
jgi:acid phosphatase